MTSFVRILKLERTKEQIASFLGLSNSMLYLILSRAEFFKYKSGNKYSINIDFLDNMYNFFEHKKDTKKKIEKYRLVQKKILQWRRYLTAQKVKA